MKRKVSAFRMKHGARPSGRDHDRGDRRAEQAARLDDRGVQRDGVDDAVAADHLGDEALPGGVVERVDHAAERSRAT